jgi:hypothetical protein
MTNKKTWTAKAWTAKVWTAKAWGTTAAMAEKISAPDVIPDIIWTH